MPSNIDLKSFIEKLHEHNNEIVRFYSSCSLIYLHNQFDVSEYLVKKIEDKSNLVRAAAIRIAAMIDGVNFSKVSFYFEWKFYSFESIAFTRDYYHLLDIDIENLTLNDSQQVAYGITYEQITPLLKNLYKVETKELPVIHPLDIPLEIKCMDSKTSDLPLWLKNGLADKDSKIVLATLQYLLYYLTNIEKEINFDKIIKLLKILEFDDINITDYTKLIEFIIELDKNETRTIVEFSTNIKNKTNFEQRFFVWI